MLLPAMLFCLPDDIAIPGLGAPESHLLALLWVTQLLLIMQRPERERLVASLARVPWQIVAFFILFALSLWLSHWAQPLDRLGRLFLWGAMLAGTAHWFAIGKRFFVLRGTWLLIAVSACLFLIARMGSDISPQVDVLAFVHRTGLAHFVAVPFSVGCVLLISGKVAGNQPRLVLAASATLLFTVSLLAMQTRGAWVVSAISIAMGLGWMGSAWRSYAVIGAVGLVGFAYGSFGESELAERVRSIWSVDVRSSSSYRLDLLATSLTLIPNAGVCGFGDVGMASALYNNTEGVYHAIVASGEGRAMTDSDFVQMLLATGFPATACLVSGIVVVWYRLRRRRTDLGDGTDCLWRQCIAISILGQVFLDNVMDTPYGWFWLGLGIGGAYRDGENRVAAGRALESYW